MTEGKPHIRTGWNLICCFGLHDFRWPPHSVADNWLNTGYVFRIECARGCGARAVRRCRRDDHFTDRHPEEKQDRND